jgi:hypothetical protein
MSMRGRRLFDQYVARHLNHPALAGLSTHSHVLNLVDQARGHNIPVGELVEEVGPLLEALRTARKL